MVMVLHDPGRGRGCLVSQYQLQKLVYEYLRKAGTAQLVGTFISSHAPMMAAAVESAPEEQRRNFLGGVQAAARRVRERGAQAVVICSNEHFTNFFLENFPQFCVGVGARHWGPVEPWLKIDHGEIPGAPVLATRLASQLPAEGFEPSFSHELRL